MKEANQIPQRIIELWDWVVALDIWSYGNPEPLAKLIAEQPIPNEFKIALSEIISGKRQPKHQARLKIPASDRMELARSLLETFQTFDNSLYGEFYDHERRRTNALEWIGEFMRYDSPNDLQSDLFASRAGFIADAARQYNVSEKTIKDLLTELRKIIKNWPVI